MCLTPSILRYAPGVCAVTAHPLKIQNIAGPGAACRPSPVAVSKRPAMQDVKIPSKYPSKYRTQRPLGTSNETTLAPSIQSIPESELFRPSLDPGRVLSGTRQNQ